MPYAVRDREGQIVSLHRHDPGVGDLLAPDHPDVARFLGLAPAPAAWRAADEPSSFSKLDAEFVRVLEDVIDALNARHVLHITDLPDAVQAKLFARKSFRERHGRNALRLFQATDFGEVI